MGGRKDGRLRVSGERPESMSYQVAKELLPTKRTNIALLIVNSAGILPVIFLLITKKEYEGRGLAKPKKARAK